MTLYKYFLIGFIFTLLIDMLMGMLKNQKLLPKKVEWDWYNRILCIVIWPLAVAWFFIAFFKQFFKR